MLSLFALIAIQRDPLLLRHTHTYNVHTNVSRLHFRDIVSSSSCSLWRTRLRPGYLRLSPFPIFVPQLRPYLFHARKWTQSVATQSALGSTFVRPYVPHGVRTHYARTDFDVLSVFQRTVGWPVETAQEVEAERRKSWLRRPKLSHFIKNRTILILKQNQ